MIDEYWTFRFFGYTSENLTHGSNKKVVVVCENCFEYRTSRYVGCSDLCHACAQRTDEIRNGRKMAYTGKKSYNWKGGGKIVKCKQCGDEFKTCSPNSTAMFCSSNCYKLYHVGKNCVAWKGGDVSITCQRCGKIFDVVHARRNTAKFCSVKCKKLYMVGENGSMWKGGKVKKICEHCGKSFETFPCTKRRRFCSENCKHLHLIKEKHSCWEGGKSFEPYCIKFDNKFKEHVRDKFGRRCFMCNMSEHDNGKKLSVHHVSYDKNCLCDGVTCEFVPLCEKCHGRTNHDKKTWERLITNALVYLLSE